MGQGQSTISQNNHPAMPIGVNFKQTNDSDHVENEYVVVGKSISSAQNQLEESLGAPFKNKLTESVYHDNTKKDNMFFKTAEEKTDTTKEKSPNETYKIDETYVKEFYSEDKETTEKIIEIKKITKEESEKNQKTATPKTDITEQKETTEKSIYEKTEEYFSPHENLENLFREAKEKIKNKESFADIVRTISSYSNDTDSEKIKFKEIKILIDSIVYISDYRKILYELINNLIKINHISNEDKTKTYLSLAHILSYYEENLQATILLIKKSTAIYPQERFENMDVMFKKILYASYKKNNFLELCSAMISCMTASASSNEEKLYFYAILINNLINAENSHHLINKAIDRIISLPEKNTINKFDAYVNAAISIFDTENPEEKKLSFACSTLINKIISCHKIHDTEKFTAYLEIIKKCIKKTDAASKNAFNKLKEDIFLLDIPENKKSAALKNTLANIEQDGKKHRVLDLIDNFLKREL